jgi:hypothetical protein
MPMPSPCRSGSIPRVHCRRARRAARRWVVVQDSQQSAVVIAPQQTVHDGVRSDRRDGVLLVAEPGRAIRRALSTLRFEHQMRAGTRSPFGRTWRSPALFLVCAKGIGEMREAGEDWAGRHDPEVGVSGVGGRQHRPYPGRSRRLDQLRCQWLVGPRALHPPCREGLHHQRHWVVVAECVALEVGQGCVGGHRRGFHAGRPLRSGRSRV